MAAYVDDLPNVIDIDAIREAGVRIGADPLGGASVAYFEAIAERHGLDLEVVNEEVDPTFRFVPLDHDGKIRMDCSSPYVMAGLIELRGPLRRRGGLRPGRRPPRDRHAERGAAEPQPLPRGGHPLPVRRRARLAAGRGIGKTLVSRARMIDLVADDLGRRLVEVPVGFKWFVDGLLDGSLGFGGEESAGASFLRRDGTPWSTDKDGILLALLAAEITAKTGQDPGRAYARADRALRRARVPARRLAGRRRRARRSCSSSSPSDITATELAGEPIEQRAHQGARQRRARSAASRWWPRGGWFAARPSGTEDIYKLYAESLRGEEHLEQIIDEAREILG